MSFQPAATAKAKTAAAPKPSVEEYVQGRITTSADKGYQSTLAWINESESASLTEQLVKAGYQVEVTEEDGARLQIKISW